MSVIIKLYTSTRLIKIRFRWVDCQLDSIRRCPNAKLLRKALASLPRTLYETYDRILKQIDEDHTEYVRATLKWLAFSIGPVKLNQVVEVLAIDYDKDPPQFIPDDRFMEPRDILYMCSSLVRLNEYDTLELTHFSVREYLTSDHIKTNAPHYAFNSQMAHEFIARTCITYLMQFQRPVDDIVHFPFPLADYAANLWMGHVRLSHTNTLDDLALDLLQPDSVVFFNWVRIGPKLSQANHFIPHPLYFAACAGLLKVSERLINNGADVNAQGGDHSNALCAASCRGHATIVQQLLKNGANVNAQCDYYGNALQAASHYGYDTIVQLLVDTTRVAIFSRGKN